jgi:hypothetical protein
MLGVEEKSCKESKIGHTRDRRGVMSVVIIGVMLGVEEGSC